MLENVEHLVRARLYEIWKDGHLDLIRTRAREVAGHGTLDPESLMMGYIYAAHHCFSLTPTDTDELINDVVQAIRPPKRSALMLVRTQNKQ